MGGRAGEAGLVCLFAVAVKAMLGREKISKSYTHESTSKPFSLKSKSCDEARWVLALPPPLPLGPGRLHGSSVRYVCVLPGIPMHARIDL